MRQNLDLTHDRLAQIFLQCKRQAKANQSASGVMSCNHRKNRRATNARLLFGSRYMMAYNEFMKGMAVGLMRVFLEMQGEWVENLTSIIGQSRGGGRDGTKAKVQGGALAQVDREKPRTRQTEN